MATVTMDPKSSREGAAASAMTAAKAIAKGPVFLSFGTPATYEVFDFSFPPQRPLTLASYGSGRDSSSSICRKRARPLADIDGQCREATKKRRLRLIFSTSRLSAPFTSPQRNVADRGYSKIAVWARQRAVPAHQFRKMAILNSIRREAAALREAQQRQIEIARQQHLERMLAVAPRRTSKRLQSKKTSQKAAAEKKKMVAAVVAAVGQQKQARGGTVKAYRKIAPDLKHTPMHQRPPTPPSEEELERQRKQQRRRR